MTSASTFSESDTEGLHGRVTDQLAATPSQKQHLPALESDTELRDLPILAHGGEPGPDQARVFFSQRALKQVAAHCHSNLSVELGGVLLGRAYQMERQVEIVILTALPATAVDHGPVHFRFTADVWLQIQQDKERAFPDLDIVGWYHTHPDLGAFYSGDDVVVHSTAFVLPWHVGLVVDPVREEACFFGWRPVQKEARQLELGPIRGYYELLDEQADSVAPWKAVEPTIQTTTDSVSEAVHSESQVYLPASDWLSLPPVSPWWGVLLGGASLLISLFLLLERILSASE